MRLLVLVPHRDAVTELRREKPQLFSEGFLGAYSFPLAAPLAALSAPLSIDALKDAAKLVRRQLRETGGTDAKITGERRDTVPLCDEYSILGYALSLAPPPLNDAIVLQYFSKIVLCETLVPVSCPQHLAKSFCGFKPHPESAAIITQSVSDRTLAEWDPLSSPPFSAGKISFRAAALANMVIRPLGPKLSFEWKVGALVWLGR
ncbi:MAG: hypothetical protein LBT01_07880 [Spirochaetaceae bacterium]|jgi:hypothetical protein|nr:hypothetical protein [Spirochaetaceae bacterium]